jgi:nucleotide-binding universal stress UspA family protein
LPWPEGTVIRLVTSAELPMTASIPPTLVPTAEGIQEYAEAMRAKARATLDAATAAVSRPGLAVERRILRGRPSMAILAEATQWPADLIILGSRGHSRIASMLLGSTSAEVVDHAPCPVLVAREAQLESVIVAADGSPGAMLAEHVLTDWPVFRGLPISVITVGEPFSPLDAAMTAGLSDAVLAGYATNDESAEDQLAGIANASVARLAEAGLPAVSHVREGSPAHEILEFALERPHPLLVLGSRGLGRLARVLMGSTARNVLYHAHGSVLIVRESATVRPQAGSAVQVLVAG